MNKAYRMSLVWFLHQINVGRSDADELLDAIASGMAKQEQDSLAIFTKMIEQAEVRAAADPDGADVTRLLQLGHQLAVAQDILGRTETMTAMRRISDLPEGNAMAQRIRAMKFNELKSKLGIELVP